MSNNFIQFYVKPITKRPVIAIRFIFFLFLTSPLFALEPDEVGIEVSLDAEKQLLHVKQRIELTNRTSAVLTEYYFHAWINAYSGRNTELNKVKLEDRKTNLHFANKSERGRLRDLVVTDSQGNVLGSIFESREFVKVKFPEPLRPIQRFVFNFQYTLKVPAEFITRYGYYENGDFLLKYFFLQPASFDNGDWILQHYKDFESVTASPLNYRVKLNLPQGYFALSDLNYSDGEWIGKDRAPFEMLLTKNQKLKSMESGRHNFRLDLGYEVEEREFELMDSLLPLQLQFLEDNLGKPVSNHLFLSNKTKREQNFFGVDDIDAWLLEIKFFTDAEKAALKLFQQLAHEYVDKYFVSNPRKNHWIKNGIQTYLQIKYVEEFFPDLKLAGHFPDNFKIFGTRPLNSFYASRVKLNERYKLLYLFMTRQNFDQPINTPLDELSNLNQIAISAFKTGLTFYMIDDFLGGGQFGKLLKDFSEQQRGQLTGYKDFRNYILLNSTEDLSWFFEEYIGKRTKINFKLRNAKKDGDSLKVQIRNPRDFPGPVQVAGVKNDSILHTVWARSKGKKFDVKIPDYEYDKILLNPDFLFPEFNDRDNYIKTKGVFKNSKKLQVRLYNDLDNPEYNQVFVTPQIKWNNYDKVQIGVKLYNQSFIPKRFHYSVSPRWSTGQSRLTGGWSWRYKIIPDEGFINSLVFGNSYRFEHFSEDLAFTKLSAYSTLIFEKNPRTDLTQGFQFTFDKLNRDVEPGEIQTAEDRYNLWNLTYFYNNPNIIHDFYGQVGFQTTEVFRKLLVEGYYRYQFSKKKRLGVRFFAGAFLNNETSGTDFFDFGTSRITDFGFNFNLLGRSESTGLLSQQFVLAEGGFKSNFDVFVDDWIVATNWEYPIWTIFDAYADAGFYNDSDLGREFIYDAGVRVRFISDFLELYFPVYSSINGWEFDSSYGDKIRFTFNFQLDRIIQFLRRGWY